MYSSMQYHNLVMMLFERISRDSPYRITTLRRPGVVEEPAAQIYHRSKVFLMTLVQVYYLRHSFDAVDMFMLHFLCNVAFLSIDLLKKDSTDPRQEDFRSMALLCTKGLHDQGKAFYLARITFQVVKDSLPREDLERLRHYIKIENPKFEEERIRAEEVQSEWPVNVLSIDDVDNQRLDYLMESYSKVTSESGQATIDMRSGD